MPTPRNRRPIIGFISTWPIYQGTTIDRYAHSLIQGISAAATEQGCDLLLGCGFSVTGYTAQRHSFWPVPGPEVDFVPVGPWNTDGLIIVPDDLTQEQSQYVGDLLASGFPVIFTTPEGPGPVVAVDNIYGIQQAFTHLYNHGHRQIAFIAGHSGKGGDSEERLRAYHEALRAAGLPEDPRLIAFGEHRRANGAIAVQQILDTGAPFTALIASNDLSGLGAIQRLTETGHRIPQDVAVVGFDDILDARSLSPSLTTVRHPTFQIGYEAVSTLLQYIDGKRSGVTRVIVPPRLIIRQSCGCQVSADLLVASAQPPVAEAALGLDEFVRAMADAAWIEARNSLLEEIEAQCRRFMLGFLESLKSQDIQVALTEIWRALAWIEERGEDAHIWQVAADFISQNLTALFKLAPGADLTFVTGLLDRLRLQVSDQIQRQTTRAMLAHMDMTSQLGLMTAELLTALNIAESAEILAKHLPQVGIKNALVALYQASDEDEVAQAVVLISAGLPASTNGRRFDPRQFPLSDLYSTTEPIHLTILPLDVDGETSGFVAFSAPNPELCAAIVHNLIAALRASRLYRDAVDGRRMAEEANQLKNRFLSMVSHELRTPLSLIVGLSEMVLREGRENTLLKPSVTQDIEQINLSAQHLGRLLGDVLDLASSEAGQLRIASQPLDLAEVLRVVVPTGEQLVQAKGLTWKACIPSNGIWIMGDRTRLRQVALNLISNAVKFSEQGEVTFNVDVQNGQAVISVSDSGIGVAPEEQETIFQEFHRSERSVREGYTGMGLGLAVCKQLIQHHGGSIGVESPLKDGRGSRFYVSLPIISTLPSQTTPSTSTQPTQAVVVLAEQAEVGAWLKQHLEGRGFESHIFQIDQEADWISKTVSLQPAAVLMEYRLAARQGWEIIGTLKRQPVTANIPVLVYTLNPEQNQGELLELDYLLKPLRIEQIATELERHGLSNQQTVLLVDDDRNILSVHSRIVQQAGYRAVQAHNGHEALDAIQQGLPALILLDLIMPEMDGFELLDRLRAQENTRNIPVIVVTGQTLTDEDMERLNRGVASILNKGLFTADETLGRIEAALARQSGLSNTAQRFVRRALAFIQAHFAEPISREEIAKHVAISSNYLTDCFRQVLGITPMTYLTRYRIQQAQRLLDTTDLSITDIALETGFSEISHFTRTFKREVGVSPHAYRRGKRPAAPAG